MDLLHYYDREGLLEGNNTHVLVSVPLFDSNGTSYFGKKDTDYDPEGAMFFIVVTVSIYSLGIVAFVAGHIFEKNKNTSADIQTSEYISTFNMDYLAQLSKLYTLRCMQRKMLARNNMLIKTYTRNVPLRKVRCFEEDCTPDGSADNIPRIFLDASLRRSAIRLDDKRSSCSNCSQSSVSSEEIPLMKLPDDWTMTDPAAFSKFKHNGIAEDKADEKSNPGVTNMDLDDVVTADVERESNTNGVLTDLRINECKVNIVISDVDCCCEDDDLLNDFPNDCKSFPYTYD